MEQNISLLPEDDGRNWGIFGYRGAMCDRAIKASIQAQTHSEIAA